MSRTGSLARGALAVVMACLAALLAWPAQGRATDLMVEDFGPQRPFDPAWADVRPAGLRAADYMGARYARMIVERRKWTSPYEWSMVNGIDQSSVDAFVADARAHEMRPYLTLTGVRASGDNEEVPSVSAFGNWCAAAATRYLGQVSDFSVWNEPNLPHVNYLSPAEYRSHYVECRNRIKTVNPSANVFFGELETSGTAAGGACEYLHAVADSAAAPIQTDGLAIHPYQFMTAPEVADSTPCRGIGNLPGWPSGARLRSRERQNHVPRSAETAPVGERVRLLHRATARAAQRPLRQKRTVLCCGCLRPADGEGRRQRENERWPHQR